MALKPTEKINYDDRGVYELLKSVAETCPKLIMKYGGEAPPFGTNKRSEFDKELTKGCNHCIVRLAESECGQEGQ